MQAAQTNTVSSTGRLAGKVAIVTGSSRGIGAAIAKQLAAEGAIVAVNYANGAEAAKAVVAEIERAGGQAHAFQADVSVRAQVFNLVDQVVKRWGRLDVFVNNSGIFSMAPLADVAEDEVDRLLGVNYKGTLWGIQAASKVLPNGGAIINVSSVTSRLALPVRCVSRVRVVLCCASLQSPSLCVTCRTWAPTRRRRPRWICLRRLRPRSWAQGAFASTRWRRA
jgi:NAD(P)-dependent dehydrogenase (short-subunit alcohol dehydrogenase family)